MKNFTISTAKIDYSQCGFNKDSSGYCRLRKGDSAFQKVLNQIKLIDFESLKCHVLTDFEK